jgi:hypothetical protein
MAATTIVVTNATSRKLSLTGDNGKPNVMIGAVGGVNYTSISMEDIVHNELLCSTLSSWITSGKVVVTRGGVTVTAAQMAAMVESMSADIYDADLDDISDKAEQLNFIENTAVAFAASPYTVLDTDTVIDANVTAGAIQLLLPAAAAANEGRVITICDVAGLSATSNITITPNGADTIDGAASLVLNRAYAQVNLRCKGAGGWYSDKAEVRALFAASGALAVGVASMAINIKAVAETSAALSGGAGQDFAPEQITVHLTTVGAPLNGDAIIKVGTSSGGSQILPVTTLTGLTGLNQTYQIVLTGAFPAIAGNATIYLNVTTADTGGGTGTGTVKIQGKLL